MQEDNSSNHSQAQVHSQPLQHSLSQHHSEQASQQVEQFENQDDQKSEADEVTQITETIIIQKEYSFMLAGAQKKTLPVLSKYEKARVLGIRARQIQMGSPIYVWIDSNQLMSMSSLDIAERELKAFKIPFVVRRPMPNGGYEEWNLSELQIGKK